MSNNIVLIQTVIVLELAMNLCWYCMCVGVREAPVPSGPAGGAAPHRGDRQRPELADSRQGLPRLRRPAAEPRQRQAGGATITIHSTRRRAARILVCAPVCARIFTIISRFLFTD